MEFLPLKNANIILFCLSQQEEIDELPKTRIPYMDLTFCISTQMKYKINGEEVILNPRDAILFSPGSYRERIATPKPGLYASFNVLLPENVEIPFCGHIPDCVGAGTLELLKIFNHDYNSVSFHNKDRCNMLLSYLLYKLQDVVLDKENPHIKNIKKYIADNISSQITLCDIVKSVHLAPEYCSSLFKKDAGINISTYILKQRTELAASLILTTALPFSEIAEKCGFSDYSYFSHVFKKMMGVSARKYRQIKG